MNVLPQAKPDEKALENGQRAILGREGWLLQSGRAELFLVSIKDGRPTSTRRFLFEVKAGGIVLPLPNFEDFHVILIATEPCKLHRLSMAPQPGPGQISVPDQINLWVTGLSSALAGVVGVPPDDAKALAIGDTIEEQDDAVVTVRTGVVWIENHSAELTYCDGSTLTRRKGLSLVPLTQGTWISATNPGTLKAKATTDILALASWQDALDEFQRLALICIARAVVKDQADTDERIEAGAHRSERLADRVVESFHSVSSSQRKAWQSGAEEDERLLAVFMIIAEAIGLDLPQRSQETIFKAKTVEEAVRSARLRQRQVALRGHWWREDLGPLIGFIDEDRRMVALLPTDTNSWRLIDPVAGLNQVIDDATAARIAPVAYMLYPTLPDRPLTFMDFLSFGAIRNRTDFGIAIATALAGGILGLATPLAMRLAFDRFIPGHHELQLFELAVGLVFAALISTAFRVTYDAAALRIDGRAAGTHSAAIMDRVLRLPDAAIRFGSADLALRFGSAESVRRTISSVTLTAIPAIFLTAVNGAMMFYYAPWAGVVALASFLFLCGLSAFFAHLQREAQKRGEELTSDVFNIVFQLVQSIGMLRTTGSEVRAFAHWGVDFAELRARSHRARKLSTVFEALLSGIDILSLAGIFLLLALLPSDNFTTGSFMAFITAYGAFSGNSMQIVRSIGTLVGLDTSWERAAPLLRAAPERSALRRDPGRLSGKLDVTNVAFRYTGDTPPALGGVSLEAKAGEFIAIVGASGSGKSTMIRLLLGLDQPLQGTIQYDGQDLRHLDHELVRRQIGVVLQSGKLFPGTLFENIIGSFPGNMDEAWEAARQAGIEDDIRALPMGMHTIVTEATAAFSGGQVQRLIIARALVGKPRILIFDEATSSLDNVSQAIVTQSLARLAVTRIVIAHRLTTVQQADRIYVFDKGRVAQTGKYDELVKAHGLFAEYARRQLV